MSESILNTEEIKIFNWAELDGKEVKVYVTEAEGVQIAALATKDNHFYFVSIKQLEDK